MECLRIMNIGESPDRRNGYLVESLHFFFKVRRRFAAGLQHGFLAFEMAFAVRLRRLTSGFILLIIAVRVLLSFFTIGRLFFFRALPNFLFLR